MYDSERSYPSSLRKTLSFFLPYRGCAVRSAMMSRSTSGSTSRRLLFFGAVLFGSRASRWPCFSANVACHRNKVRFDTPKVSLVAFAPCSFQNPNIFTLLSTSCLFLIDRNRIVLSHILNQPLVPLNLLNWRIVPQL